MKSQIWKRLVGKNIHGNISHKLVTKESHQSSTRESLRLFRFCIVSWKDPSTSKCQRILEEQDRMDRNFSKLQRL